MVFRYINRRGKRRVYPGTVIYHAKIQFCLCGQRLFPAFTVQFYPFLLVLSPPSSHLVLCFLLFQKIIVSPCGAVACTMTFPPRLKPHKSCCTSSPASSKTPRRVTVGPHRTKSTKLPLTQKGLLVHIQFQRL